MAQDASKYSKPELRENIKDRVMDWAKAVRPCKWDRILKERQNKNA